MLAKYFNTHTNRLTILNSSIFYIRNILAGNTIAEKNLVIIKDDNFHFSDYLNDLDNDNKDQSGSLNDHQRHLQNFDNKGNDNLFMDDESDLDIESNRKFILDHRYEDIKLLLDIKKAKQILINDSIKAMELYFKSLGF